MRAILRTNDRSGSILLISMVVLFVVTASMMGVLMVTANALHLCSKQRGGAAAFNLAESGAEVNVLWLKGQGVPPSGTVNRGTFNLGDGTYSVIVYSEPGNPTAYLKTYRIVSIGRALGQTKTIELVVKQASFGRYAYFTDKETSSVSGGAIWWKAGERVDGPAHSNNTGGSNFNINYNGSTAPIFLDEVTGAGSTINYTPSRPRDETTFKKVFLDGSKGYKLGVQPILLPPSTDLQKNAAWGSTSGFPTASTGVYLRTGAQGGIYIRGDAAVQLSVSGSCNQVVKVTQGSNITTITFDKVTGSVTATGPLGSGSAPSTACLGTGVVYCTGNITSLKGTVANNWVSGNDIMARSAMTIATDVNAGKYIKITDNVVYSTKPDKTLDRTATVNLLAGTLGLVSKDVMISSTAPQNLEINAVCLAGGQTTNGSFYVENYSSKTPTGTLKVLGGIIQKDRGPVGTFNSSTGQTVTGYSKNYNYDPRLATDPPPYYPTTGQYDRLSWQVLPNQ